LGYATGGQRPEFHRRAVDRNGQSAFAPAVHHARRPRGASHFDRIVSNRDYFKDLFASFGFRFIFNDGWGYAGCVSPTAFNNSRVPTQETIVLLCLRLLYNEGAEKGYFVEITRLSASRAILVKRSKRVIFR
jgi:hypothetical protein